MSEPHAYVGGELELFRHARRWKAYFARQIRPFLGLAVAEVGAGIGGTTRMLHDGRAGTWLCIEPDRTFADRLRADHALPPVEVVAGTLADVAPERRFDTILYIDVLEHIEDDAAELRKAAARLSPGGHLIMLVPAMPALYSAFDAAVGHWRRYDRARLRTIAPPGLELVRLRALDSVGTCASLANRWLLRRSLPTTANIRTWDRLLVPCSEIVDPLVGYGFGRSLLAVWQRSTMPTGNIVEL